MSAQSPTLIDKIKNFKRPNKKNMFWAWVTYQAIKGTLTTTFIWIPALIYWLQH
jgi:hypothetical protein